MATFNLLWKGKGLSTEIKIQLLQTCVFEVLLYAAETWTTKKDDQRKLLAFEMRCYRHILEINWQDHIANNEVGKQVQREWTVMDIIRRRKLQLFGHICRMSDDRLLKSLVFGMVEGERRPGRPVRRWINDILMWCGQDVQETMMMTVDRDNWRRFVAPLTVLADHGSEGGGGHVVGLP